MGVQNRVQKTANFNSRGSVRPFLLDPVFRRLVFRSFAQRSRRKSRKIVKSIENSSRSCCLDFPKNENIKKTSTFVVLFWRPFFAHVLKNLGVANDQKIEGEAHF